ncbi:DUF2007 domain-containing protein [Algibacter pacificus]|uniref:DUF2007 domain-containing protein n=1 Tax=Algibacter pacificus TaxID=2599389 RepID=UPI0011C7E86D|nr:DUF2007 domain-containing protein [Algibacter pacificus]
MKNYTKVFTGNLNDVQRVFSELAARNICAIIRMKSKFERINYPGDINETLQDILVHQDDLNKTSNIVDQLTGKNTSNLIQTYANSKPIHRHHL